MGHGGGGRQQCLGVLGSIFGARIKVGVVHEQRFGGLVKVALLEHSGCQQVTNDRCCGKRMAIAGKKQKARSETERGANEVDRGAEVEKRKREEGREREM